MKPSLQELLYWGQEYEKHRGFFQRFTEKLPKLIEQAGIPSLELIAVVPPSQIRVRFLGKDLMIDHEFVEANRGTSLLTSSTIDRVDEKKRYQVAKMEMDNMGNVRLGPNLPVQHIDQNPDVVLYVFLVGIPKS
jgi:hypothetical protein